jgi:hypothetical protein
MRAVHLCQRAKCMVRGEAVVEGVVLDILQRCDST